MEAASEPAETRTGLRALNAEFFEKALIGPAKLGRFRAVGDIDGVVTVIFVRLGSEGLSVISMRPASHRERRALDA